MPYELATVITNLYLYGQEIVPDLRYFKRQPNANAHYSFDLDRFMKSGPGRFAVGRRFEMVNDSSILNSAKLLVVQLLRRSVL